MATKMKTRSKIIFSLLVLGIIAAACDANQNQINSFEECAKARYPLMESYPRQCKTSDGKTFVEDIKSKLEAIKTRVGDLKLEYDDSVATLSGVLQRSTPCVEWTVKTAATQDLPVSQVNMEIFDSNKGVICIQMVGEPQEIKETIENVSENTNYVIKFEEQVVFEGKIGG